MSGHPNAQPAVVLLLKVLKRQGHGLKSHPTDWESPKSNSGLLGTRRLTYLLHHGDSLADNVDDTFVIFRIK